MERLTYLIGSTFLLLACFVSCSKEDVAINTPSGKSLLTAHTWHLEEVTELVAGKSIVVYRRNRLQNADDYALVRQTFREDGTVEFTDQFGNTATDGEFDLQQDGRMLKLALGTQNLQGEGVTISNRHLAYTIKLSDVDAVQYKFSPAL